MVGTATFGRGVDIPSFFSDTFRLVDALCGVKELLRTSFRLNPMFEGSNNGFLSFGSVLPLEMPLERFSETTDWLLPLEMPLGRFSEQTDWLLPLVALLERFSEQTDWLLPLVAPLGRFSAYRIR